MGLKSWTTATIITSIFYLYLYSPKGVLDRFWRVSLWKFICSFSSTPDSQSKTSPAKKPPQRTHQATPNEQTARLTVVTTVTRPSACQSSTRKEKPKDRQGYKLWTQWHACRDTLSPAAEHAQPKHHGWQKGQDWWGKKEEPMKEALPYVSHTAQITSAYSNRLGMMSIQAISTVLIS